MRPSLSLAIAVTFVWLGMVLANPVPGGTIEVPGAQAHGRIGLGIGRLGFKALNVAEVVFANVLPIAVAMGKPPGRVAASVMAAIVARWPRSQCTTSS
jgi:hypothetical protein